MRAGRRRRRFLPADISRDSQTLSWTPKAGASEEEEKDNLFCYRAQQPQLSCWIFFTIFLCLSDSMVSGSYQLYLYSVCIMFSPCLVSFNTTFIKKSLSLLDLTDDISFRSRPSDSVQCPSFMKEQQL